MSLKKLILNSLKSFDLELIKIQEPKKEFFELLKKEIELQRSKNYSFPPPKIPKEQAANFVFFLRTLDFRRWEFPKNWEYKNKKRFWALFARLEDLLKIGFEDIDYSIFKKIISPKESEFLAKLRYKFFKLNLFWLNKNYKGDFRNYFESHKNSYDFAMGLTRLERFRDFVIKPPRLYFLKPNQLLFAEYILAIGNNKKHLKGLNDLTVFTDYRLPQILMHFNIIVPSSALFDKIKKQQIIRCGSKEELEIRAATILSCELIREKLKTALSFEIDMALWNLAYKIKIDIPHFRAKSIFY